MSFTNAISWFEIPVTDMQRAQAFYETIFGFSFVPMNMPGVEMCMFPIQDMQNGVGGALVKTEDNYGPSADKGVLIYLNGSPDLQHVLDKVKDAGGKITMPKMEISPDYGFMGVFVDTEGNRIGLHSMQ